MIIFSAISGLQPTQQAIQLIHDGLGYPIYFIQFISIAKLLGANIILIPGRGRIKDWTYAVPGVLSYYFWLKKIKRYLAKIGCR